MNLLMCLSVLCACAAQPLIWRAPLGSWSKRDKWGSAALLVASFVLYVASLVRL